ncbi:response regulator [Saliphagus sp. GCM10025308]
MTEEPFDILVIEDNPGDVRLIENGFDESDVPRSLTVVTDGAEALDYLYRRNGYEPAAKPDLVLLDLNVPKLTGNAVLERITDDPDFRSTPILVLSGSQSDDHVLETYQQGRTGTSSNRWTPTSSSRSSKRSGIRWPRPGRSLRGVRRRRSALVILVGRKRVSVWDACT